MSRLTTHLETHRVDRIGWLRAAALGVNDGIVPTSSLIVGTAAAAASRNEVLITGVAGLVAGAMSMTAGEYVSVSSQSDTEQEDLARERQELLDNPASELEELAAIYISRGIEPTLARQVVGQFTGTMPWQPTPATNWGSPKAPRPDLSRLRRLRPRCSPLGRQCPC